MGDGMFLGTTMSEGRHNVNVAAYRTICCRVCKS